MSGADFLHPTADSKPGDIYLGIKSLEQDAQESFSGRREIPCIRPSGTLCCYPSLAFSQGVVGPLGPFAHTTSRLPGSKLLTVCTLWVERAAAKQHAGSQRDYRVSCPLNLVRWFIFFPQKLENFFPLVVCYRVVEGKDTGEFCCLFWRCVLGFPQLRDMQLSFCCSFPLFWGLCVCASGRGEGKSRNNFPLSCLIYKTSASALQKR